MPESKRINNACWDEAWPEAELEQVLNCPVCGSSGRDVLHENVVDNVFFVAPGKWTIYQCDRCHSAYLDPRPDQASIHKAYGIYYTHQAGAVQQKPAASLTKLQLWRQMLVNGYTNYRFGTHRMPQSRLGFWGLSLLPRFRQRMGGQFRYLPKPSPGQALLDVGCGNGEFLCLATEAGWRVRGVEPDPKALEIATSQGFDVLQGGIDQFSEDKELFDVITMSHVIEHVHEPKAVIEAAYRLLKPGGTLYIETPNIQSSGAVDYGKNWRGLETPRHLVIFSRNGLAELLSQCNFINYTFKSRSIVRKSLAIRSFRMQSGLSPYDDELRKLPFLHRLKIKIPRRLIREEFLTVLAAKK